MTTPAGFIGRQSELRILGERLAAAGKGHPQVVYVEGEAGGGKSTAVAQFEKAHRRFCALGADPYVRACAAELAALQVTAATGTPAAVLGLSRAELAVARLAASGLTNREV